MSILFIQSEIQDKISTLPSSGTSENGMSYFILVGVVAILVALFFYFLRKTDRIVEERLRVKQNLINNSPPVKVFEDPSEEVAVAIALAISTYKIQMEELENLTLTIQKVNKQYSPWSSKIYTLRQLPR